MRLHALQSAALVMFMLLTSGVGSAQPYQLRYGFEKGRTYTYKRIERTDALSQTHTGLSAKIDRTTEAFLKVTVDDNAGGAIRFTFVQDTAYIDDRSPVSAAGDDVPDFDNLITKKPVRVTMDALGVLRAVEPLAPIVAGRRLPPAVTDQTIARQAVVFPVLPSRSLDIGATWTEQSADTARPTYSTPDLGAGAGLRLTRVRTVYTVDSLVTIGRHRCVRISWEASTVNESKMLFREREYFTEEESTLSGVLWFDVREGLPVRLTLRSKKNTTTAAFAREVAIVPSTITKDITLQLSEL